MCLPLLRGSTEGNPETKCFITVTIVSPLGDMARYRTLNECPVGFTMCLRLRKPHMEIWLCMNPCRTIVTDFMLS
jgi:hypothetical protein